MIPEIDIRHFDYDHIDKILTIRKSALETLIGEISITSGFTFHIKGRERSVLFKYLTTQREKGGLGNRILKYIFVPKDEDYYYVPAAVGLVVRIENN